MADSSFWGEFGYGRMEGTSIDLGLACLNPRADCSALMPSEPRSLFLH